MTTANARWKMGLFALALLSTTASRAAEAGADSPAAALTRGIGQRVANFTLKDVSGTPVSLYGYVGKRAVVIAFLGADCPVGNLYAPRLVELNREYHDKGVVFLAINANAHETVEQAAAHAREHGIDFPVLKDKNNLVADLTLAERTCEVLVIDGLAFLRYRGAIDDQYVQGAAKDKPSRNYLRDALDAVLAKRPVAVPATAVSGCLIDRIEPKPALANGPKVRKPSAEFIAAREAVEQETKAPVAVGKVTYAADVAAIVQNKCQSCHRPGEPGPFALLTYDDARRHAAMIAEVVDDRRMPPWHADPHFGPFANDRSLTPRERATLLAWVEQGAPLGDPAALPPPRSFPEGWGIGTPDVVFEIPEPYEVAAQGTIDYVYMKVPTNFQEDRWVRAAEARPGDRGVVHHIIVYVDDHKGSRRGGGGHLCGYAPGDMPSVYPAGTAKKVPAGSDLIFQVHYTPNGKRHTDRSRVGLIFAQGPVEHEAHTLGIANGRFVIPPGADNHPVSSSFTFPNDAHLLSFMPHMHLRGKSFSYKATFPDGKSEDLLSVPAYDFGWQSYYILSTPKAMPKGTRIDCLAHFDNSSNNPYNPDPAKSVTWGDQTFQEMMIGYIDYIDDAPLPAAAPPAKADAADLPNPAARGLLRTLRAVVNPKSAAR